MNSTQKMIAAVALVAVLAVAAVGVGYAYTAQTSNSGNATEATYGIITIGTDTATDYTTGKINGNLNFNTKTVVVEENQQQVVKKYAALNDAEDTVVGGNTHAWLVSLGTFDITIDDTKAAAGDSYDLKVSHTVDYLINGLDQTKPYYIGIGEKVTSGTQTYEYYEFNPTAATSEVTILNDIAVATEAADVYAVALFANGGDSEPSIDTSDIPAPEQTEVFTGSQLKFTVEFTATP